MLWHNCPPNYFSSCRLQITGRTASVRNGRSAKYEERADIVDMVKRDRVSHRQYCIIFRSLERFENKFVWDGDSQLWESAPLSRRSSWLSEFFIRVIEMISGENDKSSMAKNDNSSMGIDIRVRSVQTVLLNFANDTFGCEVCRSHGSSNIQPCTLTSRTTLSHDQKGFNCQDSRWDVLSGRQCQNNLLLGPSRRPG